jgi:hypothetical protein
VPLVEIRETNVSQRCAHCDAVHCIEISSLEVGVAFGAQRDGRVVGLPPCARCGATEFLVRSTERTSSLRMAGSSGHLHRLLVDHLHAELVRRAQVAGSSNGTASSSELLALPLREDERRRWFPHGLKIEEPIGEPSSPKGGES